MEHAEERITERLADAGFSPEAIAKVWTVVRALGHRLPEDTAVQVLRLGAAVNEAWGDRSNGDTVWAVYRGGECRTVFLRRSTQPHDPEAFRVSKVLFLRPDAFRVSQLTRTA